MNIQLRELSDKWRKRARFVRIPHSLVALKAQRAEMKRCADELDALLAKYSAEDAAHAEAMAAKDAEIEKWRTAYMEYDERTRWVQDTARPKELGKHRADVLRLRIEQAEARAASAEQDAARLDALELLVDQQPDKMLLLHHGNGAGKGITGLGLSNTRRSLRHAIDQAAQRGTGETK
ncbi:MAG TPA: hypothetical protein VEY92_08650 [Pseudoxanthomonas sp.]|nr:hypothetical protein [Pseudoxanthomonas sp.]